jgi:type I restriction enzyme S subunit
MEWNEELQKEIPFGWANGSLSMISKKIYSGGTPSTEVDEYWNGDYYWFSSGETGNKYILKTEKTITKLGINNSTTKKAEILSTVVATAGQGKTRGQSALIFKEVYINQSVIAIEPLKKEFSLVVFLNINSRYDELRNDSDAQSIRGSINSNDIKDLPLIVPTENVMQNFHKIVLPFFEIISNKLNQNQKLTDLKDLLLSKLATIEN